MARRWHRHLAMAWWRADQGRGRRAHVRCRVTTWKPLSEGWGRRPRRSHLLSTPLHRANLPCCHAPLYSWYPSVRPCDCTVLYSTCVWAWWYGSSSIFQLGEVGGGTAMALLHTAAAYLLFSLSSRLPHSIPHARAFITCPALPCPAPLGVEPAQRQKLKKKKPWHGSFSLHYSTVQGTPFFPALVLSMGSPSMLGRE